MTSAIAPAALAWMLLAAGVLLVPLPAPHRTRLAGLVATGRLVAGGGRVRRGRWCARRSAAGVAAAQSATFVAVGAAGLVTIAVGPALGATTALIAWAAAAGWRRVRRRRADARLRLAFATSVRLLVAELKAGTRPAAALAAAASAAASSSAGPVAGPGEPSDGGDPLVALFTGAAAAVERGGLPPRVPETGGGPPLPAEVVHGVEVLAQAWELADATGAPLAGVLARVADDLDAGERLRSVVASALAGPSASAGLLACLPVLGVVLGTAMGADPVGQLLGTPVGRVLCAVGVALDVAGVAWTRALTAHAERGAA